MIIKITQYSVDTPGIRPEAAHHCTYPGPEHSLPLTPFLSPEKGGDGVRRVLFFSGLSQGIPAG